MVIRIRWDEAVILGSQTHIRERVSERQPSQVFDCETRKGNHGLDIKQVGQGLIDHELIEWFH
jgi:hypothetical protein